KEANEPETLESIGESYQITRERVRQIEKEGLKKLSKKVKKHGEVLDSFGERIDDFGGLKREDRLVYVLGDRNYTNQNYVTFLLSLGDFFDKNKETKDFHTHWLTDKNSVKTAEEIIQNSYDKLKSKKKPVPIEKLKSSPDYPTHKFISYLEISKDVKQGPQGLYGLKEWPEVSPRGVKDMAYITLKREGDPLHFKKVAELIGDGTNPQTVHNELIKDDRFVLVGRGIYALREWGYEEGEVKDVIKRVIEKADKPLPKEEIVDKVLGRRMVKKNTIIQNLSNKQYFKRTPDGKYTIRNNRGSD
ncbi:MAG: sigma factor-like helix-turn-helix DNA-binding protein, partial [Patescibacteria group bacterium]